MVTNRYTTEFKLYLYM